MPRKPDLSIIGKTFNNLRVESLTDQRNSYGQLLYSCTCLICGANRMASKSNLQRGEIKDCGQHKYKDRVGERYGYLTIIGIVEGQTVHRQWRCICDCGNERIANISDLLSGYISSCGCKAKEHMQKLFIDGTEPCKLINTDKLRSTNTSGVTGVCWDKARGLWSAEITFKNKKYYLGRFAEKEDAIKARKDAEKHIWGDFLEWYNSEFEKKDTHDAEERIYAFVYNEEEITLVQGNPMNYRKAGHFRSVDGKEYERFKQLPELSESERIDFTNQFNTKNNTNLKFEQIVRKVTGNKKVYQRICKQCGETFTGGAGALYCASCAHLRKNKASREYAAEHLAERLEYGKQYRDTHPGAAKKWHKTWYEKNREKRGKSVKFYDLKKKLRDSKPLSDMQKDFLVEFYNQKYETNLSLEEIISILNDSKESPP